MKVHADTIEELIAASGDQADDLRALGALAEREN
jgi:hypothetical protein